VCGIVAADLSKIDGQSHFLHKKTHNDQSVGKTKRCFVVECLRWNHGLFLILKIQNKKSPN